MKLPNSNLVNSWNSSYDRKENNVLEPYEELVKFLARYVYDRDPSNGVLSLKKYFSGKSVSDLRFIDIGCGIGGQSQYIARHGFFVHGCDVSHVAISRAKARIAALGLQANASFSVVDPDNLHISDAFDIGVACASLDSMPYDCALEWMVKVGDKLTDKGLFFATLIGPSPVGPPVQEQIVCDELHESGTVQSFFDEAKIQHLFAAADLAVIRLDLLETTNVIPADARQRAKGRFSVVAVKN